MNKTFFNTFQSARADGEFNSIKVPTGGETDKTNLNLSSLVDSVHSITIIALDIVGFVAAAYFLFGAFLYIISYGEDAKATKAKQTMTWAIYGLVIVIFARVLVSTIGYEFGGEFKFLFGNDGLFRFIPLPPATK